MPSSVTVSWSGPGNMTCDHAYYVPSVANPELPIIMYYIETRSSSATSTATITLPANCTVYNIKITNSNGAVGQGVSLYGASVNVSGKQALIDTLNSKVASSSWTGSETATMHYTFSGNPSKPTKQKPPGTYIDMYEIIYETRYFAGVTLQIMYYTQEEMEQGIIIGEDILPDEFNGDISFIIEPYGENRQRYGVAIGGAPTSQSDEIPSFDCYIPTTFTNTTTMTLNNEKFIYQTPLWQDLMYSECQNNYYPHETWPIQYCCVNSTVYIRGFVMHNGTTWALNKTMFTLPEDYRPSYTVVKECFLRTYGLNGSKKGYAIVTINTNGTVVFSYPVQLSGTSGTSNTDYSDAACLCLDLGFRK